jgi:hypothetical protein
MVGSDKTFKAGLDIKYGIWFVYIGCYSSPWFWPNKTTYLNLEPFEQILDENRPFFTEGTNLFNIGNLFYSHQNWFTEFFSEAAANEEITNYPSTVDLINAIKYLDEQRGGLGFGFLNAITEKYIPLRIQKLMNTRRSYRALDNYNIGFDQRFNQNSSFCEHQYNTKWRV